MHAIQEFPLLSLVIWLPIAGGCWALVAGEREGAARSVALVAALVTLIASAALYAGFETGTHRMQFVERAAWVDAYDIQYYLGVDGISMPLILLTTFTTVLVVTAGWEVVKHRQAQYMAALLFQEGFMNGAFASLDSILFYVFWEAQLIPMFIIIGVWGGPRRVYATIKFFLYTFLGSVLMLVALLYLYQVAGSFAILDLHRVRLDLTPQILLFIAFLLAFAVKVPMWPVHTWLPDAHVEAPTGGSVILAAIMLKLGGYGFLRFSLPITPDASSELDWLMIALSLIAVVYIGFVAIVQPDMKKLIAYSSVAHMGFATLGFFLVFRLLAADDVQGAMLGIQGGMIQMISHGFISGALFLCVGVMYERLHSRQIGDYGGVGEHHAGVRGLHDALRACQLRPARHLGFRGRVPRDPGQLQGELLDRVARRYHPGARCRLLAVDVQARDLRSRRQRRGRVVDGLEPARVRRPGRSRRGGAPVRDLAGPPA